MAEAVAHAAGDDAQTIELYNVKPTRGQFNNFSRAMQTNTSVTVLRMYTVACGPSIARDMGRFLDCTTSLKSLILAKNNLTTRGMVTITSSLQANSSLHKLVIIDNRIGNGGVTALANVLKKNSSLQELTLAKVNLGREGVVEIVNVLRENPFSALTTICLAHARFGSGGFAALADMLSDNKQIVQLNLCHTGMKADSLRGLASAILVNTILTALDISYNKVGVSEFRQVDASGFQGLIGAIKINSTLEMLSLSHTLLHMPETGLLMEALATNRSLKCLDLSGNRDGDDGMERIARMLTINPVLDSISLQNMSGTDAGIGALARVLKTSTSLTQLDLHHNNIGTDGAAYLAGALRTNRTLRELSMNTNSCREHAPVLLAALASTPRLEPLSLMGQNLVRRQSNEDTMHAMLILWRQKMQAFRMGFRRKVTGTSRVGVLSLVGVLSKDNADTIAKWYWWGGHVGVLSKDNADTIPPWYWFSVNRWKKIPPWYWFSFDSSWNEIVYET